MTFDLLLPCIANLFVFVVILSIFWIVGKLDFTMMKYEELEYSIITDESLLVRDPFKSYRISKYLGRLVLLQLFPFFSIFLFISFVILAVLGFFFSFGFFSFSVEGSNFKDNFFKLGEASFVAALYFLSLSISTKSFIFLQALIVKYDKQYLYKYLPLQYSNRLFIATTTTAYLLLTIATTLIVFSTVAEIDKEKFQYLMYSSILLPWSIVLKTQWFLTQFFKNFVQQTFDAPATDFIFTLVHRGGFFASIILICLIDIRLAYIFIAQFSFFVILPFIGILLLSKKISIKKENLEEIKGKGTLFLRISRYFSLKIFDPDGITRTGLKSYMIFLSKNHYTLPFHSFGVTEATDISQESEMIYNYQIDHSHFTNYCLPPFFQRVVLSPFVFFAYSCSFYGKIPFEDPITEDLDILLCPPIGRSVWDKIQDYDQVIFAIDSAGFYCGVSYFLRLKNKNLGEERNNIFFLWELTTDFEPNALAMFLTVKHGTPISYFIMRTQGFRVVRYALEIERTPRADEFFLSPDVRLEHILNPVKEKDKRTLFISIGTSYFIHRCKLLSKKWKVTEFVDICQEESLTKTHYFPLIERLDGEGDAILS